MLQRKVCKFTTSRWKSVVVIRRPTSQPNYVWALKSTQCMLSWRVRAAWLSAVRDGAQLWLSAAARKDLNLKSLTIQYGHMNKELYWTMPDSWPCICCEILIKFVSFTVGFWPGSPWCRSRYLSCWSCPGPRCLSGSDRLAALRTAAPTRTQFTC